MDNVQLLQEMFDNGIEICIPLPAEYGSLTHFAKRPEEILEYLADRNAFYASTYGVSVRDFLLWKDSDFSVSCSATTSQGKPCKQIVAGGSHVPVKTWLELQGEYCRYHGGE